MKKKASTSLLLALAVCTSTAFAGKLDVPLIKQEHSQWCWAASAKMVLDFLKAKPFSQCKMANKSFGVSNACGNRTFEWNNRANSPNTDTEITKIMNYGGIKSTTKGALSWTALKSKINAGKPFILGWYWTAGGGHAVVVTGYSNTSKKVYFNDPWPGSGAYTRSYNATRSSSDRDWDGSVVPN